jgi:hypothetical protein
MKLEDTSSESKEKTAALSSKASHHPLLMQVRIVFPSFDLSLNMKFSSKFSPLNNLSCSWIQTSGAQFEFKKANHAYLTNNFFKTYIENKIR